MLIRVNLLVKIVKYYFLLLVDDFLFVWCGEWFVDCGVGLVSGVDFVLDGDGEYFSDCFVVVVYVVGVDFCIMCLGGLVVWVGWFLGWVVYLLWNLLSGFWLFLVGRFGVDSG